MAGVGGFTGKPQLGFSVCSAKAWSPEACLKDIALPAGTRDIVTHRDQELLVNCTMSFGYKPSAQLDLIYHPFSMASPHQQATGSLGVQASALHVLPEVEAPAALPMCRMILCPLHPPGSPPYTLLGPHSLPASHTSMWQLLAIPTRAPTHLLLPAPIHPPPALTHSLPLTTTHPACLPHPCHPESQGKVSTLCFREQQ